MVRAQNVTIMLRILNIGRLFFYDESFFLGESNWMLLHPLLYIFLP